ncbi:MAG: starch-binding protein [Ruminococcus sp.]|nr:starch-binding protein [Ruminococcus sp.]
MKGEHSTKKVNSKPRKVRSIILSVVAVLELLLLLTSMTFSWFEGLTSLEMYGQNIRTAPELKSHAMIGEFEASDDAEIDDIIDLTKFFDAQRDVRLSPVSSADGKRFFAAYEGTPGEDGTKYRELSPEDINANIITFQFNLSSPDGPTDIYLSEIVPRVFINGVEHNDEYCYPYRFGFSDGETTHVLSTNNVLDTEEENSFVNQKAVSSLKSDNTANIKTGIVERTRRYSYYKDHLTHIDGPDAGGEQTDGTMLEPLFHLKKDEIKTIRVSIWLEALDYECLNNTEYKPVEGNDISFGLKLCSSWSIYRNITVYDYTATRWIDNKDDSNNTTALYVRNMDGDDTVTNRALYKLEYNSSAHSWTGSIPIGLQNCEFLWRPTNNPTSSSYNNYTTWQAPNRYNSTEITMLGSTACVWDLQPSELKQIHFRDYMGIKDTDDMGNSTKLSTRIVYDGRILEYSLTDTPEQDHNGNNSWSCWIPNEVKDVSFLLKGQNSSNETTILNYWTASNRGTNTIYRATNEASGGVLGEDKTYILYLSVASGLGSKLYVEGYEPAISYTGYDNINYVTGTTNKQDDLDRTLYNPSEDTWPLGLKPLTKVSDDLYYIAYAQKPATGTTITAWNRSNLNFNTEVPINTSFGINVLQQNNNNTFHIYSVTTMYGPNAKNNYYLNIELTQTETDLNAFEGTHTTGVWGDITIPSGTYPIYFVPMYATTSVTATYSYEGNQYVVPLRKDAAGDWFTNQIPDSVTTITFTDSSGMQWRSLSGNEAFGKSSTSNYFYPYKPTKSGSITASGNFCSKLTGNTVNFKHYNSEIADMYVRIRPTITVNGASKTAYMYLPLTKGSDNLTWSTSCIPSTITTIRFYETATTSRYWNTTSGRSTTASSTAYALNKNTATNGLQWKTGSNQANWKRIYLTDNWAWNTLAIHYWGGHTNTSDRWPGDTMYMIGTNSDGDSVYCALVPSDSTGIIFNNNNNGKQTSNITENITDMKGFYISGGSGTTHTVGTWDIEATFLNNNSSNVTISN